MRAGSPSICQTICFSGKKKKGKSTDASTLNVRNTRFPIFLPSRQPIPTLSIIKRAIKISKNATVLYRAREYLVRTRPIIRSTSREIYSKSGNIATRVKLVRGMVERGQGSTTRFTHIHIHIYIYIYPALSKSNRAIDKRERRKMRREMKKMGKREKRSLLPAEESGFYLQCYFHDRNIYATDA